MGNCIKKESSMQWGGDDWSDDYSDQKNNLYSQNYAYKKIYKDEAGEEEEEEEDTGAASTNDNAYPENMNETTQVRLKITRRQLEELLTESTTSIQGVSSVQQVLAHLINVSMHNDDFHSHQHHSWRPHLPTITEV